mgnify:CR=1 FL=1
MYCRTLGEKACEVNDYDFLNNDIIDFSQREILPTYECNCFDDVSSWSTTEQNQKRMTQYYSDKKEIISKKEPIHNDSSNYEKMSEARSELLPVSENWKAILRKHIEGYNEETNFWEEMWILS